MKNAKKLLLLLLSLVLLVGIFAVAAFAEDATAAATVVYPDGTVDTYTAAGAITPSIAAENGLYKGKGNTLYQDAGAGWIYTDANGNTVTEITEEMIAAGAKITASGYTKVYSVINIHFTDEDYSEYITGTGITIDGKSYHSGVYVKSGTSGTATYTSDYKKGEDGTVTGTEYTVDYSTTKRVAGDYTLYFYDEASLQTFFSTSVSLELGGVTVDYKDLRALSSTKIYATLFADHTIGNTFSWGKGYDRSTNLAKTNIIAQGEGGNAYVYFDMNGHSIINNSTSYMELTEMSLVLYSSQPGAHFYKEASAQAFYVSDGCAFYIGNNDTATKTYSNNLIVHAKSLFATMYGSGASIIGGHYYQSAGATAPLFDFARRLNAIQNASFYAQNGIAILDDNPTDGGAFAKGTKEITNCSFYSFGTSNLVNLTQGATPAFKDCSFYNINLNYDKLASETSKTVAAKTVTFADGTTEKFFAESLEAAKNYVEGLPKAKSSSPYIPEGNALYYVENPIISLDYDASFNATQKIAGERQTVYYYLYRTDTGETVYSLENNIHTVIKQANFKNSSYNVHVKLYHDVNVDSFSFGTDSASITVHFDLNGHTVSVKDGINITWVVARIFSSVPGAHFYCTGSTGNLFSSANSYVHLGVDGNGNYGDNISFHAKSILSGVATGRNGGISGGSYYQTGASSIGGFFSLNGAFTVFQNAKIYVLDGQPVFTNSAAPAGGTIAKGEKAITNCKIYSAGTSAVINASVACSPVFYACDFINVAPAKTVGLATAFYDANCRFNLPCGDALWVPNVPLYTVRINPIPVEGLVAEDGTPIVASILYKNADISNALKISAENSLTTYWAIGTTFVAEPDGIEFISENKIYYNPYYSVDGVSQIVDGKIAAAGEITLAIEFRDSDDIAFAYSLGGIDTFVAYNRDCGGTAEGIFNKFYELFNVPASSCEIKMYMDMTMTKAMAFGPFIPNGNESYYDSMANGPVTLDLNGCTITIPENVKGINMSNANGYAYDGSSAIFGLEGGRNKTFTFKSSKENGKIVNLSPYALVAIGEWDKNSFEIDGENLTIDSYGPIFGCFESELTSVTVNGGTYIYRGPKAAFILGGKASISNAVIILKDAKAYAPIAGQSYPKVVTSITVTNTQFYAQNAKMFSYAYQQNYTEISGASSPKSVTLKFDGCTFAGVSLFAEHGQIPASNITFSGNCIVSRTEDLALVGKAAGEGQVVAYNTLACDGINYKVVDVYTTANTALVNWGFGITEYWVIGATATHDDAVVDDYFTYEFKALVVGGGENNAQKRIVSVAEGAVQTSLTLQSQIILNIHVNAALAGATVTVGGETNALGLKDGYYVFAKSLVPNDADEAVVIVITIGDNVHTFNVGVADYAKAVLGGEYDEELKNLTYAMVEYVRVMAQNTEFLAKEVEAPADYETMVLVGEASTNNGELLEKIAFRLDNTIEIAVEGAAAEGKDVNLVLATGRSEWATVSEGIAIFKGLYVNEFFGEMTITVEGETYTYSLANYLEGIGGESAAVQALYNYAFYAVAYVKTLPGYPAN